MVRSRTVKGSGSARTEGARRATGGRADVCGGRGGGLGAWAAVERGPEARRRAAPAARRVARRGPTTHWGPVDGERAVAGAGSSCGTPPPFADAEVAAMSATTSATTGRRYGLQRVCRAWERSRSALYARRAQAERAGRATSPRAAGRHRHSRVSSSWRPFAPTSPGRRSRARAIARYTRGCGSWTGSASPVPGCCA